jgi:hypothetical protein
MTPAKGFDLGDAHREIARHTTMQEEKQYHGSLGTCRPWRGSHSVAKDPRYNAGNEISLLHRSGAGCAVGAAACAARRVCVGNGPRIRRFLFGESQCHSAAGFHSRAARPVFSEARLFALRVLLRLGIYSRLAERVGDPATRCPRGSAASAHSADTDRRSLRSAPAHARASESFLIG